MSNDGVSKFDLSLNDVIFVHKIINNRLKKYLKNRCLVDFTHVCVHSIVCTTGRIRVCYVQAIYSLAQVDCKFEFCAVQSDFSKTRIKK